MAVATIAPGGSWNGTAGSGGTAPAENATVLGAGFTAKAIGSLDVPLAFRLTATRQINVGCDNADSAHIKHVVFWCEGTSVTVTTPSFDPVTGTWGYAVNLVLSGFSQDGDAQLWAYIVPNNGLERRLPAVTFTVIGTGVSTITPANRYISTSGNDSWDGTQPTFVSGITGPWKSLNKATGAAPNGANIWMAAGTYVEDSNTGTIQPGTRLLDVRLMPGLSLYDVWITRSRRFTPASNGGIYVIRAINIRFDGIALDASKMPQIQVSVVGGLGNLILENSAYVDPNGPGGPLDSVLDANNNPYPKGWYASTELAQIVFRDNEGQFNAAINTVISNGLTTGLRLTRGVTADVAADAFFFQNSVTSSNTAIFNSIFRQNVQLYQRRNLDETVIVATGGVSYDGVNNRTTLTWANTPGPGTLSTSAGALIATTLSHGLKPGDTVRLTSGPQVNEIKTVLYDNSTTTFTLSVAFSVAQTAVTWEKIPTQSTVSAGGTPNQGLWFLSGDKLRKDGPPDSGGATNGWPIYQMTMPSGTSSANATTTISGDASTVIAGDTARQWIIFHADAFQVAAQTQTAANIENIFMQRLIAPGLNYQTMLLQPGSFSGSGTITTSGDTLTCSANHNLALYDFARLGAGSQNGEYRLIVEILSPTTARMASAFSVDQAVGVIWWQGKTIKDVAMQISVLDHKGGLSEFGHWNHGQFHIVMRQMTHKGTSVTFRNALAKAYGTQDCLLVDSIWGYNPTTPGTASLFADTGFSTAGLTIDNNHFEAGTVRGTNTSGPSPITYDATWRVVSGTTHTVTNPRILVDLYGNTVVPGVSLVGAAQAEPVVGGGLVRGSLGLLGVGI